MKNLLKKLRRAFRRRKLNIVTVWCPDCWENYNPYEEHNCYGIVGDEISFE